MSSGDRPNAPFIAHAEQPPKEQKQRSECRTSSLQERWPVSLLLRLYLTLTRSKEAPHMYACPLPCGCAGHAGLSPPFVCLDEFDVFMDAINRRYALRFLLEFASRFSHRQFLFFTPLVRLNLKNAVANQ